jgi:hypothetical protein
MTSEVLIFNKRAVVVAADSAVTTSAKTSNGRPRYAKTATKIFELSNSGNVAIAIFGGASIDAVPWEVAIKLFRKALGTAQLGTVAAYVDSLLTFLTANPDLFPPALLDAFATEQFEQAAVEVMKRAGVLDARCADPDATPAEHQTGWAATYPQLMAQLTGLGVAAPLTQGGLDEALQEVPTRWAPHLAQYVQNFPVLAGVNLEELAELAHRLRFAEPEQILGYTGVAVAGFGDSQIFPGYRLLHVHGHVGREIYVSGDKSDGITHSKGSLIVPLAQKSMIDLFTDGFGFSLWSIIEEAGREVLEGLVADLKTQGATLQGVDADALIAARHLEFMRTWTRKNWKENYDPLMEVLTTLSVEEMAHLAETLLLLQSLKERVTSASEEVGGPIDVAALTKSEGLVWLKRKHFFDAGMNVRYVKRLESGMQR